MLQNNHLLSSSIARTLTMQTGKYVCHSNHARTTMSWIFSPHSLSLSLSLSVLFYRNRNTQSRFDCNSHDSCCCCCCTMNFLHIIHFTDETYRVMNTSWNFQPLDTNYSIYNTGAKRAILSRKLLPFRLFSLLFRGVWRCISFCHNEVNWNAVQNIGFEIRCSSIISSCLTFPKLCVAHWNSSCLRFVSLQLMSSVFVVVNDYQIMDWSIASNDNIHIMI